jgi:hypothetical protein
MLDKPMKIHIYLLSVVLLLHFKVLAQHRIEVRDKAPIVASVISYNNLLVHFQTPAGALDSIPTEQVSCLVYGDSLQVLVFPELMKGKKQLVSINQFLEAMQASDYTSLLHSYAHLYDIQFLATKNGLALTPDSRQKLASLIRILKTKQELHLYISVHADSVGKAATNQLLTERRAKALSTELLRNGITYSRFTLQAKGESEPFITQPSLSRRLEFSIIKIAKTEVLYAQKYIPPAPLLPQAVLAPTPMQESPQSAPVTPLKQVKQKRVYKYWTLAVGGEVSQLLASASPQWTDEKVGMGLKTAVGVNVQFTKRFGRTFGVVINVGYRQWEVERRYILNGEQLYTSSDKLIQYPLHLGFKTFLFKGIYMAPQANVVFTQLQRKTDEANPIASLNQRQQTFYMGATGTLGYETTGKRLVMDFGLTYTYLPITTQNIIYHAQMNDPMHLIGFKVTTGIRSKTH